MPRTASHHDDARQLAVTLCIVTTVTVATVQILIGWMYNLISVGAEGLHTAADLADSIVAFILIRLASRPADRLHPFGHGKYDSLAAVIEGCAVGAAAIWAITKGSAAVLGLSEPEPEPAVAALIAMTISSVIYMAVSTWVLRIAKTTGSPAVRAEALHLRTHVYITISLLIGLFVMRVGQARDWPHAERLDALVAVGLGVFLLVTAYRIIKPGFVQIVDTALPDEDIERMSLSLDPLRSEFVEIHAVRTRSSGTERHIDFHLMVKPDTTVAASHDLAHRIEQRVVEALPNTRLLIHIEPASPPAMKRYQARSHQGSITMSQHGPAEGEEDHHDLDGAHES